MKYFDEMSLDELLQPQGHECSCGRRHDTGLKFLRIGQGVIETVPEAIRFLGRKKPFLVADANTWKAAGEKVAEILTKAGIPYSSYVFPASRGHIEPDEAAVGSIAMAFDPTCDLFLAVGSGVMNDCCRVMAHATGRGHMVVGTAPSMDGYASNSSSMIVERIKTSLYACCPQAIIADVDIMKNAPMRMLWAGLGDMLAKYNALCEWRISNIATGEFYCENVARLVRASVRKVAENASGLVKRAPEAIEAVVEGLILSGVCMDFAKVSRPASGLEHYFSHMWEMEALRKGEHADLHGICVGVGLCLTMPLYDVLRRHGRPTREQADKAFAAFSQEKWEEEMREVFGSTAEDVIRAEKEKYGKNTAAVHEKRLDNLLKNWDGVLAAMDEELPATEEILSLMRSTGMPTTPEELGLDAGAVHRAFVGSREIRDKYLLSSMLWDLGLMKEKEFQPENQK